ncbi:hypothetical protein B0H34DRAFT_675156 [Crassisporium funariophilum]|nr:hypothetical protein B0H34DRAFT_675156 [Crassisporium funariophilum]
MSITCLGPGAASLDCHTEGSLVVEVHGEKLQRHAGEEKHRMRRELTGLCKPCKDAEGGDDVWMAVDNSGRYWSGVRTIMENVGLSARLALNGELCSGDDVDGMEEAPLSVSLPLAASRSLPHFHPELGTAKRFYKYIFFSHTPKPINIGRWQKQDQDAKIDKFVATAVKVPHQFDPKDPKKQLIHWRGGGAYMQKDRWRSTSFDTLKLDTDPKIEVHRSLVSSVRLNSQPYAVSSVAPYYWESELAKEYTTTQVYNLLVAKKFNHYLYNGTGSGCLTWTTALGKLLETEGVLPKGPEARFTTEVEEFRTDSNYWVPDEPGVKFYN